MTNAPVSPCIVCRTTAPPEPLYVKWGHPIVRCPHCGLGMAPRAANFDPSALYDEGYFQGAQRDGYADYVGSGLPDISWHGTRASQPDWSGTSRVLAFLLGGHHAKGGTVVDDDVYVAVNSHWDALPFEIPAPALGRRWHVAVNTSLPAPQDIYPLYQEPLLEDQTRCLVGGRSIVVLVGR